MKSVGLLPTEEYIQPRLSIGNAVSDHEFSTGHFKVQVDAQSLCLSVKNVHGRIIWKCKYLSSQLLLCSAFCVASEENHVCLCTLEILIIACDSPT